MNSHSYKLSEWKMSNSTRAIDSDTRSYCTLSAYLCAVRSSHSYLQKEIPHQSRFIEINDRRPINHRWTEKDEINVHTNSTNKMINLDLMMRAALGQRLLCKLLKEKEYLIKYLIQNYFAVCKCISFEVAMEFFSFIFISLEN